MGVISCLKLILKTAFKCQFDSGCITVVSAKCSHLQYLWHYLTAFVLKSLFTTSLSFKLPSNSFS